MQITDSTLSLSSSYSKVSYTEVRERLEIHQPGERRAEVEGGRGRPSGALGRRSGPWDPLIRQFEEARDADRGRRTGQLSRGMRGLESLDGPRRNHKPCTCDHDHVDSDRLDAVKDPKLKAALDLIEKLTGMKFDLLDTDELAERMAKAGETPALPTGGTPTEMAQAQQPTIIYDRIETRYEAQTLKVAANAQVTTGDGRRIDVDLQLNMDRLFAERSETHVRIGPPLKDPLVLDLGSGPGSIDGDNRVAFDLDADGTLDEVPWVSDGAAFLALDRNGNGTIDDGTELFGARTGDGFAELAALDDDRDGWIDEDDAAWEQLRLVSVGPDDGRIDVAATDSLRSAGVGAIAVSSVTAPLTERDVDGNVVAEQRDAGIYLRESGTAGSVRQVDLAF